MRIESTVTGGLGLPLRRDRIPQFERHPAKPVVGLGILRIVSDGVAQVDLGGAKVALAQGCLGGGKIIGGMSGNRGRTEPRAHDDPAERLVPHRVHPCSFCNVVSTPASAALAASVANP